MKNRLRVTLLILFIFFNTIPVRLIPSILPTKIIRIDHYASSLQSMGIEYLIQNIDNCNREYRFITYSWGVLLAQENSLKKDITIKKNSNSSIKESTNYRRGILIKVMFVTLIVWLGLGLYLFILDRRISKLEVKIDEL